MSNRSFAWLALVVLTTAIIIHAVDLLVRWSTGQ